MGGVVSVALRGLFSGIGRKAAFGLGALMLATALPAAECRSVVVSGDPEYPPFSWYDGRQLRGAAVEIVLAALDRIKLPYEVRYVGPFARVLRQAETGEVDIVAELKRTPEREEFLSYAATPMFSNPIAVFVRSDWSGKFGGREDLVGLRGGMANGHRFGGDFDEFLKQRLNVEVSPRLENGFSKLLVGRLDYFVIGYYPGISFLTAEGLDGRVKVLKPYVAATDNFVGWSRKSTCLGRLAEFDSAMRSLLASGMIVRTVKDNLGRLRDNPVRGVNR